MFKFILRKTFNKPKPPPKPTLIRLQPIIKKKPRKGWFQCHGCPNTFSANIYHVASGATTSCGCYHKKVIRYRCLIHSHSLAIKKSKTYITWANMIRRCKDVENKDYGGRGITVCDRWKTFEFFIEDMGEKPVNMSIERIDNNKGYCKTNCKWATKRQQDVNKRSTIKVSYRGTILSLLTVYTESECKLPYELVRERVKDGCPIEQALTKPRYSKTRKE